MVQHKKHRGLKALLFGASLLSASYAADRYNFNDTFVYPLVYHDVEAAEGFARDPFSLEKKIVLNPDNKLEVYFGNRRTEEYFRVKENNHTATGLDNVLESIESAYDQVRDYLRREFSE
ncbi:MAG: hypothetical protein ACOC32_00055 [Nanoarchaeota archaeon]